MSSRTLTCEQGHAFDVARSGYVNLVPGGRRPAATGDSPEMLAARRRFLDGGWYEPVSALVNRRVGEALPSWGLRDEDAPSCVVEVGSGTGHYLAGLRASVGGIHAESLCWFGVDVSKAACRLASSVHKALRFVVADVRQGLPLRSGRALVVLDVFAPRDAAEFRRMVHLQGLVLVVIPAPDHLGELVRRFGSVHVHPGKEEALLGDFGAEGFRLVHREGLRFDMELGPAEVCDLVRMGPSAHHVPPGRLGGGAGTAAMVATASFVLLLLQPRPERAPSDAVPSV